jgi:hypothetical protein
VAGSAAQHSPAGVSEPETTTRCSDCTAVLIALHVKPGSPIRQAPTTLADACCYSWMHDDPGPSSNKPAKMPHIEQHGMPWIVLPESCRKLPVCPGCWPLQLLWWLHQRSSAAHPTSGPSLSPQPCGQQPQHQLDYLEQGQHTTTTSSTTALID